MARPIPLAYTFGNHMHWVDMQWLWGYDVLPGSIDDMLAYCEATGVKGNINFDGIGYEKLASESPEHLAKLRSAIADGTIEVVGGSYGQPYGLFHGGESNVRQRVFGVRTAMRVLGCRPKTFWEEEFDAYPQLPQMLAGCGFTGASLYFQWTWHTPEVPMEEAPVVLWEGHDGTQIPTATRNRMNLHQWPEDFQILLDDLAANPPSAEDGIPPLVLQWLELMPTQDWMCRSELMIPMLLALKQDPRFEVLAFTLGEYLAQWEPENLPVRKYAMDDFWHGMTLGKNGDNHPKQSAELEGEILEAECAAAILGLFGRPYDPWDVYPTWEFEEMWRNLLAFQHHDNHECEGLCGHVAEGLIGFGLHLLSNASPVERLAKRLGIDRSKNVIFNRLGWAIPIRGFSCPPMGYRVVSDVMIPEKKWLIEGDEARFEEDGMVVRIDLKTACILELTTESGKISDFPIVFVFEKDGKEQIVDRIHPRRKFETNCGCLEMTLGPYDAAKLWIKPRPETDDLEIGVTVEGIFDGYIDPGYKGSVRLRLPGFGSDCVVSTDGPYSVQTVGAGSSGKRKYPEGDWMTSTQWFESVKGAFTSQTLVDFHRSDGTGLLISHTGAQQWFRTENGFENVTLSIDPWDGNHFSRSGVVTYRLFPHKGVFNSECIRRAQLFGKDQGQHIVTALWDKPILVDKELPPMPTDFSAIEVHSTNVLATAFYREQESFAGRGLENYAGKGMGHPYILRLVEYDGVDGEIEVTLPGPIAKAFKTNMMGEIVEELTAVWDDPTLLTSEPEKLKPFGIEAVRVRVPVRAYEIVTLYLDIVPGRKQFRDLDAKREIWATVHRVDES